MLKLDKAEVLHGKKFERVSLTLMNRALDPDIQKNDKRYFLVQSEQEIWLVGCFQVEKESYDILQWVFQQTRFPDVITAQSNGEQLEVPGYGSFPVEWHLSADMKTIKCMYGLQHGPLCKMNCIYCEQKHERLRKRRRVWEALKALQPYFTGLVLTDEQRRNCKSVIEGFGRAFIAAHGEGHVTHYIVSHPLTQASVVIVVAKISKL